VLQRERESLRDYRDACSLGPVLQTEREAIEMPAVCALCYREREATEMPAVCALCCRERERESGYSDACRLRHYSHRIACRDCPVLQRCLQSAESALCRECPVLQRCLQSAESALCRECPVQRVPSAESALCYTGTREAIEIDIETLQP
jgi:hypothetical protein